MPLEDLITFGTSALDRAAELRTDPDALNRLMQHTDTRVLPVWRGKPLCEDGSLGWLLQTHQIFDEASDPAIFLGLDEGRARFARDVSRWEPETEPQGLDSFMDRTEQHHPSLPVTHLFTELRAVMTRLSRREAELAAMARSILGWHRTHGFCSRCGTPSVITHGGWQRSCTKCGGHHFPRTDPVVIMLITRGNDVLVGRSPGWPEGMYSLLAGFVEPGETIEAAVRREVWEEAGIRVGAVRYLASQPWPYPSSLMFGCAGEALSETITRDPNEIEDARWVSREEMVDVFAGTHMDIRQPRRGAIAHSLLYNWLSGRAE